MDLSTADSSIEGVFEGNAPPSPSPAPRQVYPSSPKDITMASNLGFRPPPRPGSSTRKGRKSDFTTTSAPPPLPSQTLTNEYRALVDSTNLAARSPSRSSKMPDQEKTVDITRVARERLQLLRQENETLVNSAGMLGQGLLGLRTKIESLMDELAEELAAVDQQSEDASPAYIASIRDLGERIEAEIEELEAQKRTLFSDIATHNPDLMVKSEASLELVETPSKATRVANAIRNLTATPGKSPASAAAHISTSTSSTTTPRLEDRRSRNAAVRQAKADTDLINEIQAGLVQEVRRLQGLLKERDDQRIAIERSHAEVEKQLDQYKPKVIQMTEAEDALKQENWDLSVAKQNLEEQLSHINSALKKAELDNLRLNKDVAKARETADSQRLQIDNQTAEIDRLNKARDTEIALARRERAGMQRNVSDLQGELQRFRTQQLQKGSMSRSVSNSFASDTAHDDMPQDIDAISARLRVAAGEGDSPRSANDSVYSADGANLSPLGNRLGRDKEAQDLRAKLAMAQRKAGKDAAEKRRVREKNVELQKLLVQSGVRIPHGLDDDAETSEDEELHWMDEFDANSPTVKRSHARAARPTHRPRLGKLMGMVSSDSNDSIVEYAEYEEGPEGSTVQEGSPSRASLDGMDPAYADVMPANHAADSSMDSLSATQPVRRGGHRSRMSIGGSPLARSYQLPSVEDDDQTDDSPIQRGTIKASRRGGAGAHRSISNVFQPSALGNELDGLNLEQSEQPDLVTPALAERDLQHTEAISALKAEHDQFVEAIHADHAAAVEAIHATHTQTLDATHAEHDSRITELVSQHTLAIDTLKTSHHKQIDALTEDHQRAIAANDERNAAQLASAVAERNEIHQAAIGEARSRHSRALAEQVTASSAELATALALHKTSSEDAQRKHREERERADASHAFALSQIKREHQDAVESLTAAHAQLLDQASTEHAQLVASKDQALTEASLRLEQSGLEHTQALAAKDQALQEAAAQLELTLSEHTQLVASKDQAVTDARAELASTKQEHARLIASKEEALQQADATLQTAAAQHVRLLAEKDTALSDASALLERTLAEHVQQLTAKDEQLASAEARLEQTRAEHSEKLADNERDLQQSVAQLDLARAEHAQLITDKDEALKSTNAQLEQQRQARFSLEATHASTLQVLRDTHAQDLAAREQQLAKANAEIETLQHTITTLNDELSRLRTQISDLEQSHASTNRELDETRSNLDIFSEKVRRQEETASELTRQKEAEAVAAAAAVAARSEALSATEAEKEQQQAAHVLAIAQKDRQHNDALKALDDSHHDAVLKLRAEHKQTLAARDAALQTHKDDADRLRSSLQSTQQEADQLRSAVDLHKEECGKLRDAVQARDADAEMLRTTMASHQDQIGELQAAIATHVADAETLQAAIQRHKDESDNLRGTVREHEDNITVLRNTVQTHKDEAGALRDAQQTHNVEADQLRKDMQVHRLESDELRLAVQKHKDESNELHSTLETQRAELDSLRSTVDAHVAELGTLRATIGSLDEQLTRSHQESGSLQASKAAIEKGLLVSKTDHEMLAKQHDDSKMLIASLQSKVRYLESAIAAEKSSTEQNRLSSDKELQTIQSALNTAHKKVREQESGLAKMEATLAATVAAAAVVEAQLKAKNDIVTDTENEAYEDAVENVGIARTSRARDAKPDLRENSCQTDDDAWVLFQQQKAIAQPQLDSLIGQGGVVVLGDPSRPRDSVSTFGPAGVTNVAAPVMYTPEAITGNLGQRKSTESSRSRHTQPAANEAVPPVPALPDKSKPPVMAMPGPPKMPPPSSAKANVNAPQRPLSPPPADLLARAQQRHLQLPANGDTSRSASRASSRIGPPPSALATNSRIRQPSSGAASLRSRTTSSDTTASNARQTTPLDASMYGTMQSVGSRKSTPGPKGGRRPSAGPRTSSAASFVSDVTSELSRRMSMMSSAASEADQGDDTFVARGPGAGLGQFGADTTDPAIIHAITQTMIGEYMYKYTRKSMGRVGHSDKRHKRYFWVHPYTKTLYWTLSDPGGAKVSEGTSKSASIEHVRIVEDLNPSPPGLHHESLIVATASREVKITAPNRERHEAWLAALEYLVRRPTMQDATVVASNMTASGAQSDVENDPAAAGRKSVQKRRPRASASTIGSNSRFLSPQRSFLSRRSTDDAIRTESTPQHRKTSVLYPSIGKRSDSAAKEWLQMHEYDRELAMSPTRSVRRGMHKDANASELGDDSYDMLDLTATQTPGRARDDPRLKTAEEMLEEDEPEGFDGLTNVRACCDGRHDVGSLAHNHTHNHRREGNNGYGSDKGSRRTGSRLHHRESSGGSRFSSIGLKSRLDAAVRSAEEREPVPRLPSSILAGMETPRDSLESTARAKRPRKADATFANLFAPVNTLSDATNTDGVPKSAGVGQS